MVYSNKGVTHESVQKARMQVLHARRTEKRRIFMTELSDFRHDEHMKLMESLKRLNGPIWYQPLSGLQRDALDDLPAAIYKDMLQERPIRTRKIIKRLGIYPHPNNSDLMTAVYMGRNDPKGVLAHLFLLRFGHPVENKPQSYNMIGRLLMTGIYYLGQDHLMNLLKDRFKPPPEENVEEKPKPKRKQSAPESPYLHKMVATLYEKPTKKPYVVPPLPNLDELNEPFEEDIVLVSKPPPPPPPPPPPKKVIPISYCEKQAGIYNKFSNHSLNMSEKNVKQSSRKPKKIAVVPSSSTEKKVYGLQLGSQKRKKPQKLVAPNTKIENMQYTINGVSTIGGRKVFHLANVVVLPLAGEIIHGGFVCIQGEMVVHHLGVKGKTQGNEGKCNRSCDCLKYEESIMNYLKKNKCRCGHFYDHLPEPRKEEVEIETDSKPKKGKPKEVKEKFKEFDLLPFFEKPTKNAPMKFNYENIYNFDERAIHVAKEFDKLWKTDDILQTDTCVENPIIQAPVKKKKKNVISGLGPNPQPADYVRCALRPVKNQNLAARLPDVHLAPELREWMRFRLYGPYSRNEKEKYLSVSNTYWQRFKTMASKGYSHIATREEPEFQNKSDWGQKMRLNTKFNKFRHDYIWDLFRSYVKFNNYLWTSMFQDKFPDKRFRQIFFAYLYAGVGELCLVHPYSSAEAMERFIKNSRRRYVCKPKGAADVERL